MSKILSIDLVLFPISVEVFFGSSIEEILSHGKKMGIEDKRFTERWVEHIKDKIEEDTCDGFVNEYGEEGTDILIWLNGIPASAYSHGVLVHEISHAVDRIASMVDGTTFLMNEFQRSEPKAYLSQYLFKKMTDVIAPAYRKAPRRKALSEKNRRKSVKPAAVKS